MSHWRILGAVLIAGTSGALLVTMLLPKPERPDPAMAEFKAKVTEFVGEAKAAIAVLDAGDGHRYREKLRDARITFRDIPAAPATNEACRDIAESCQAAIDTLNGWEPVVASVDKKIHDPGERHKLISAFPAEAKSLVEDLASRIAALP